MVSNVIFIIDPPPSSTILRPVYILSNLFTSLSSQKLVKFFIPSARAENLSPKLFPLGRFGGATKLPQSMGIILSWVLASKSVLAIFQETSPEYLIHIFHFPPLLHF